MSNTKNIIRLFSPHFFTVLHQYNEKPYLAIASRTITLTGKGGTFWWLGQRTIKYLIGQTEPGSPLPYSILPL